MNPADVRLYHDRWKAVQEIERQELRALTPEKRWKQLNELVRFAIENDLKQDNDDGEMQVFLRWARIKAAYDVT